MNENPGPPPDSVPFVLDIALRPARTQHAIFALRRYLKLMEDQMPTVQKSEMAAFEETRPSGNDENEQSCFASQCNALEQMFEEDLIPTMRYSFAVFLHTVLEASFRTFCLDMQRERQLPIAVSDLRGSAIDQPRIYLDKFVNIQVVDFPEWQHLQTFQKVRDCIVHQYGYLNPLDSRHDTIRKWATPKNGVTITDDGRVALDSSFCQRHLIHIETFFKRLFEAAGWKL